MDALIWKTLLVGGWIGLLALAEWRFPAHGVPGGASLQEGWGRGRRLWRNLGFWPVNSLLSLAIVLPLSAWAAALSPWSGPDGGPLWLTLLHLLLLDGWIYLWHRMNHEWNFLWRFHQVHHLDETLDLSTALRFHGGELLLSAVFRLLPIMLFGIPFATLVLFESLVLLFSLFHHANLKLPKKLDRGLSWLIVTPNWHWLHHHAEAADLKTHYGTILTLWDRMAGSLSRTSPDPGLPIGIPGQADRPWRRLIWMPFLITRGNP